MQVPPLREAGPIRGHGCFSAVANARQVQIRQCDTALDHRLPILGKHGLRRTDVACSMLGARSFQLDSVRQSDFGWRPSDPSANRACEMRCVCKPRSTADFRAGDAAIERGLQHPHGGGRTRRNQKLPESLTKASQRPMQRAGGYGQCRSQIGGRQRAFRAALRDKILDAQSKIAIRRGSSSHRRLEIRSCQRQECADMFGDQMQRQRWRVDDRWRQLRDESCQGPAPTPV